MLGKDSSSFFSWNVTEFEALISLIEHNFSGILLPENISMHGDGSLARDSSHGFLFHSPFATPNPSDDPSFESKLSIYREKVSYLVKKFNDGCKSSGKTVYFYTSSEENVKLKSIRVRDTLMKKHENNSFTLVVIQEIDRLEKSWDEECLANLYTKRFAPWHDATDGHVQSYDNIFKQFPFSGEMHFAGF